MGAFSLVASISHAALVALPDTNETPGVLLAGSFPVTGGAVLAELSSSYTAPFGITGTLRTIVAESAGPGSTLDFYYQLVNTSPAPDAFGDEQISRLIINNGAGEYTSSVGQTNSLSLLSGVTGTYTTTGLKPARTADRGNPVGNPFFAGSIGFDFPIQANVGVADPLNIASGQASSFLVVHTNSTTYKSATASVNTGFGISNVNTFAAIPEPSSLLFGLGMFGVALTSRAKRRAAK